MASGPRRSCARTWWSLAEVPILAQPVNAPRLTEVRLVMALATQPQVQQTIHASASIAGAGGAEVHTLDRAWASNSCGREQSHHATCAFASPREAKTQLLRQKAETCSLHQGSKSKHHSAHYQTIICIYIYILSDVIIICLLQGGWNIGG